MKRRTLSAITVRRKPGDPRRGWLVAGPMAVPVALGRGGMRANKREGDGGTPMGSFRPVRLWWRGDRHARPLTQLPARRIRPDDGWCEDPNDRHYNQPVRVAPASQADRLARLDPLYDFIVEVDHNTRPRTAGRGSAVFLHVARPGFTPTAGCIALEIKTLRQLLARLGPRTRIRVI